LNIIKKEFELFENWRTKNQRNVTCNSLVSYFDYLKNGSIERQKQGAASLWKIKTALRNMIQKNTKSILKKKVCMIVFCNYYPEFKKKAPVPNSAEAFEMPELQRFWKINFKNLKTVESIYASTFSLLGIHMGGRISEILKIQSKNVEFTADGCNITLEDTKNHKQLKKNIQKWRLRKLRKSNLLFKMVG